MGTQIESRDFRGQTAAMMRRLLPRIPQARVQGFERMLGAGEVALALEELVHTVVNRQIPVTGEERDTLYRLVRYMTEHTKPCDEDVLAKLDRLNLNASLEEIRRIDAQLLARRGLG